MEQTILTPEGAEKIKSELSALKTKRKEIIEKISRAKEQGDLSENAEYHTAREEQSFNEGRIQELERIFLTARVVSKGASTGKVSLGSKVTLSDGAQKIDYTIVGSHEASIKEGKISIDSPLAQALLGKEANTAVEFESPSGSKRYKILEVT